MDTNETLASIDLLTVRGGEQFARGQGFAGRWLGGAHPSASERRENFEAGQNLWRAGFAHMPDGIWKIDGKFHEARGRFTATCVRPGGCEWLDKRFR